LPPPIEPIEGQFRGLWRAQPTALDMQT